MEFRLVESNFLSVDKATIVAKENQKFEFKMNNPLKNEVRLTEVMYVGDAPSYDGEYEVTPTFDVQTLETANKMMEKDVTIDKIPHSEVSNSAGGKTFYIGRIK